MAETFKPAGENNPEENPVEQTPEEPGLRLVVNEEEKQDLKEETGAGFGLRHNKNKMSVERSGKTVAKENKKQENLIARERGEKTAESKRERTPEEITQLLSKSIDNIKTALEKKIVENEKMGKDSKLEKGVLELITPLTEGSINLKNLEKYLEEKGYDSNRFLETVSFALYVGELNVEREPIGLKTDVTGNLVVALERAMASASLHQAGETVRQDNT